MNEPMERSWVTPLNEEDREYFSYFRTVCKRYNINPSRATRLEYDFVTRVAESEFYLQKAATLMKWVEAPSCTLNVMGMGLFIRRS